jgi:ribonuclease HI
VKIIEIWTDGSSLGNPGPGGWGVVMKFNDKIKELSGGEKHSTNNRMELTAVIKALEAIKISKYPIKIWTDSRYVVDAVNKGWVFNWNKKPNMSGKKNPDLWLKFLNIYNKYSNIEFLWVKGHNGDPNNERCDRLAVLQANKYKNDN